MAKDKKISYEEEIKLAKEKRKKEKEIKEEKIETEEMADDFSFLNGKEKKKKIKEKETSILDIEYDKEKEIKKKKKDNKIEFRGEEFIINNDKEEKKEKSDKDKKSKLSIFFLIITLLVILGYAYYLYKTLDFKELELLDIVKSFSFVLIAIVVVLVLFKINNKRSTPYVIILTLILMGYSIFSVSYAKEDLLYVSDFINHSYSEVLEWASTNNISLTTLHEFSDTVEINHVIMQEYGVTTLVSDIDEFTITISDGPNPNREIIIPNFIGFNYDDVMKYIKENHLTNVEINFIKSDKMKDTVIEQIGSGTMKRNDLIKFTFSYGEEIESEKIKDLKGLSLFEATSYLKRNGTTYEIEYEFSDKIEKGHVISQDKIDEIADNIKLVISKGSEIIVPDLSKMSSNEITKWATNNNIKIKYDNVYNKEYDSGKIIKTSVLENDKLEEGSEIVITISLGSLVMPDVKDINEFKLWATTNNISFEENFEFSTTIKTGELISVKPNPGDKITENDTIVLTISKGKSVSVPNLVGLSKTEVTNKCKTVNLSCSFKYGDFTENTKKDIAIGQSKKSGSVVSEGANVTVTLSSGIIEKVTVPSFKGKSKSEITSTCSSLGINCNFSYNDSFSDTPKDVAISQDKTGKVNKGTSVNIKLSKGSAKTYENVFVDGSWLKAGNPEQTKANLKKMLEPACPGVNFTYTFRPANSGIGLLASDSPVKVGANTFVEGKTYNIIILSN